MTKIKDKVVFINPNFQLEFPKSHLNSYIKVPDLKYNKTAKLTEHCLQKNCESEIGNHLYFLVILTSPSHGMLPRGSIKKKNIFCEKIKKLILVFEFRLQINFSLFCLGHFGQVGSKLGSHEAGVEIDTG